MGGSEFQGRKERERERKVGSKQTRGKEQAPQLLPGGGSMGVAEEPMARGPTHHHAKLL